MRIGTNHGSLSDRIMSRYGDTAMGMVESAMEFLRIARCRKLPQHCVKHEVEQPASDGAGLQITNTTNDAGV